MNSSQILGLAITIFAGLWIGGGGWPIKLMRHFAYEQFGFVGMLLGLIVTPWAVTLLCCPHAIEAFRSVDSSVLIKSNLFSLSWGVANVLCLMCFVRIGFSLTGGILFGVAIPIGVALPMIFKGSGLFSGAPNIGSPAGLTVLAGAVLMLVGMVFTVLSGLGRERALKKTESTPGQFKIGLLMAFVAGVLSVGNSFSFVYSQGPIVSAMKAYGAGEIPANFAVWAVGLFAGGLVNVLVPAWMLTKKKAWGVFLAHPSDLLLAIIFGLQPGVAFVVMGRGMLLLGLLGASVGFGVSQAMQLIGNQIVGFVWKEWKGVVGTPRRQIFAAIVTLIIAVGIMAIGNSLVKPLAPASQQSVPARAR